MMYFTPDQEKLVRSLLPEIVKVNSRNVVFKHDGLEMKIPLNSFVKGFDTSKILVSPELTAMVVKDVTHFRGLLTTLLNKMGSEVEASSVVEEEVSDSVQNLRQKLGELTPCVNTFDAEEIILVDKKFNRSVYDAELLRTTMMWEDADIYNRAYYAKFEYNPRRDEKVYKELHHTEVVDCLNTYTKPRWMSVEIESPQIPPLIDKFMKHLFPIQEELEYVYDWLNKSLTDRAYVYLLLNGEKKTGKNTFKFIFKALHGLANSVDGKKSTLTTQFNGQLSECRAIIFDEIKFSEEEENIMKEIQNDNVAIEKKGVDATRGSKIHCSMLLLNNDAKDNYIAVDSRRFSPMTVTDKPLLTSMTEEEIAEMVGKVREDSGDYDVNFVANFGHWILQNGRNLKWGKEEEYKGPKFYELVQTSLSEWRRFTLKMIEETKKSDNDYRFKLSEIEEKFYKKLGSKSAKKYPDYGRVINFLKHYRNTKGELVADYERVPGEYDFYVFPFDDGTNTVKEEKSDLSELDFISSKIKKDDGSKVSEYDDGL